ncbi:hypothetical protein H5410_041341 [Solanum commersonii]|uniref:Gag-pro-like protein n=1 Tax=Solanum commersonii TaxID=4109 RepID=A0A9J5XRB1_SOLCO|nr:hypothetical protein H5410_041341 [Solanum commersonii]
MIPIKNLESTQNIIDIQNEEKMVCMEQELEILREELCQVRHLAKLSATTFPTFKMPIYFPKADLPSSDLLNQPEQTKHTPTRSRVPPSYPTTLKIVADLSNRDPTIPIMQQILGAHVTASFEPHVPPGYVVGAPTFTTLEMEKDDRLKEDALINVQLHGLRKALKSLQVTRGTESLDYDDLCIHPDIDMPVGYKPPKFDMFDGKGDPHAHLRAYYMMSMMGQKFTELVKMGDFIEGGVKFGKI